MKGNRHPCPSASAKVGSIALPTYRITGENPNPVFDSRYGVAHIYPYTLRDEFDQKPEAVDYRTVILENRFLRATILPELGGRLWSLYDKLAGREVFYRNSVVKFAMLAIRGAFFAGGMEFSFPVAHSPTTCDPVNWDARERDGCASVTVGGIEHISNMEWSVTLSLFDERCALAQDVELDNPTMIPGRYHYWTNAAVAAGNDTEFVYPMRRVRSYEFSGSASWPYARVDLIHAQGVLPGMEGVPTWPASTMHLPVNLRWQKNIVGQVSIFGREVEWNFFGVWQHGANHGFAHVADSSEVKGMKLWSWGTSQAGRVNQSALTSGGSEYAETQCGAMETQLDFDFLGPGERRAWREWWIPLRGLGGLTAATVDLGARVGLIAAPGKREAAVEVGLCPALELSDLRIAVTAGKRRFSQRIDSLTPSRAWTGRFTLDSGELGADALAVEVERGGSAILGYATDRAPEAPTEVPAPTSPNPTEADSRCAQAERHENFDDREKATDDYRKALKLEPNHPSANYRLGLLLLRAADFSGSRRCFEQSAAGGVESARFYLGVVDLLLNRLDDAKRSFASVSETSRLRSDALVRSGMLLLRDKDWEGALGAAGAALQCTEVSANAPLLKVVALRKCGLLPDARLEVERILHDRPLCHLALFELRLLDGSSCSKWREKLERMIADDPHYAVDMSCFYLVAGLDEEAIAILAEPRFTQSRPMAAYLLASLHRKKGADEEAARCLSTASAGGAAILTPGRLEEVLALEAALEIDADDPLAHFGLGTFHYAHGSWEQARRHWEAASRKMVSNDVLLRNLGLLYWRQDCDASRAIDCFERGLAANPKNYDLYACLDDVYRAQGLTDRRAWLADRIAELTSPREDLRKRRVVILTEIGRGEEAVEIMEKTSFVPLEMDQSFHDVYVDALLQQAERQTEKGDLCGALASYRKALDYPKNIGVGRPLSACQAEVWYRLGCAFERLGRYRDAIDCWYEAAGEHHPYGTPLFHSVQKSLDKLARYSEVRLEPDQARGELARRRFS